MALGSQSLAGVARVSYEAVGLAEFRNDNARAEASYRDSTRGMSDDAIKLELAQDKLRRSLQKGPAAYREQARAELSVRNAERQLRGETDALSRSLDRNQRELGQTTRGAIAGSGLFRGLGRSVAFASGAFLGGTGLVYAIRSSIGAAIEQDKILANLRNSLQASGFEWSKYGRQIEDATAKTKALSAFDDEELYASLQRLIRGTGDVNVALQANAVAADLARGANIGLDQASKALLRAYNGQTAGLSRLGVQVEKGVKGVQALDAVQRKFAGAAEAFGESSAGAVARFQVGIQDLQKAIGRGILPEFTKLVNVAADWLNKSENQERVERDVAAATKLLADGVRGLAGGLREVNRVVGPVVDQLGGMERTAKLAFEAFAIYKLAKIALAIRGLGIAFGFVGTSATAAAVTAVAAENAIGTAAIVNAGKVGILGKAFGFALSTAGLVAAGVAIGDIAARGPSKGKNDLEKYPRLAALLAKILAGGKMTPQEAEAWSTATRGGYTISANGRTNAPASQLAEAEKMLKAASKQTTGYGEGKIAGSEHGGHAPPKPKPPAKFTMAQYESQLAAINEAELDAATTKSTADDARVARRRLALARRALNELKLNREERIRIKQERNRALSDLAAIEQAADQASAKADAQDRSDRMTRLKNREAQLVNAYEAAKLTEKLSDDRKRLQALIAFYREQSHNMDLTVAERRAFVKKKLQTIAKLKALDDDDSAAVDKAMKQAQAYYDRMAKLTKGIDFSTRAGLRKAALRYVDETGKPKTGGGLSAADVHRMQFDFLSKLTGEIGEWGSNFQPDGGGSSGQMETNSHLLVKLARDNNIAMQRLVMGSWHAGAQLASAELSAAGWGVGF